MAFDPDPSSIVASKSREFFLVTRPRKLSEWIGLVRLLELNLDSRL